MSLNQGDIKEAESFEYELAPDFLYQLHGIHHVETYFHRMCFFTSNDPGGNERGLWGDKFCTCWLDKWLNVPIEIW